ncbi:hypothetical protein U1Q18_036039 [Sarracenia purpurea var. burkii]
MLLTSPTSLSPCPWHVDSNSFLPTHVAGYARSQLRLIVTTVTPSRDSGLTSALPPTVANQSMFISEVPARLSPYQRSPVAPLMELSRVVPNRL